jgi:NAD(P)-dependent dehydrogenase (short-subunit alcohol dehydrogenase family)
MSGAERADVRLRGKVAIVTGAARGIGRAVATRFAREGAQVVLCDLDAMALDEVRRAIASAGGEALAAPGDVSDAAHVRAMVADVTDRFGTLGILVNNAATTGFGTVVDTAPAELDHVLAVNVRSMWICAQEAIPHMRDAGGGAIVNMASITGIVGAPGLAAYATSKGAIITFTRTLALEVAEAGVRVNCICPASIETPMLQASFDRQADPAAARARNVKRHPLGRLGTPDDVANLALFLASDEALFVTGGTYVIDGGALLARRWQE